MPEWTRGDRANIVLLADVGDSTAKLVLFAIDSRGGADGCCIAGLKTLAAYCNASKSTVVAAIDRLKDREFLPVQKRMRENGSQTTNRYVIEYDALAEAIGYVGAGGLSGSRTGGCTTAGSPYTGPPDTGSTHTHNERSEPGGGGSPVGVCVTRAEAQKQAERFADAYPKRSGRSDMIEAARALLEAGSVSVDALVYAAEQYGIENAGKDKRYLLDGVNWLRKERWLDYRSPSPAVVRTPNDAEAERRKRIKASDEYDRLMREVKSLSFEERKELVQAFVDETRDSPQFASARRSLVGLGRDSWMDLAHAPVRVALTVAIQKKAEKSHEDIE